MQSNEYVFETERLGLRPFKLDDLDDLALILCDTDTMKYYPRPFSREDALAWIKRNQKRYEEDGFGLWPIEWKETGEFLGNCGLVKQIVDDIEEVEVGWHIHRNWQRQGIATEAGVACRDRAFEQLGLERVVSLILEENVPSRRVAEKLDMTIEKKAMFAGLPHLVYVIERATKSPHEV